MNKGTGQELLQQIDNLLNAMDYSLVPHSKSGVITQVNAGLTRLKKQLEEGLLTVPIAWSDLSAKQQYQLLCLGNYLSSRTISETTLNSETKKFLESLRAAIPGIDKQIVFNEDI